MPFWQSSHRFKTSAIKCSMRVYGLDAKDDCPFANRTARMDCNTLSASSSAGARHTLTAYFHQRVSIAELPLH